MATAKNARMDTGQGFHDWRVCDCAIELNRTPKWALARATIFCERSTHELGGLINTPLQRGVPPIVAIRNRFSGFQESAETAEAVRIWSLPAHSAEATEAGS